MREVRAYCDGELPAADLAAFERHLAEDAALRNAVASERALRERVGAIMEQATAPDALRDRVRSALATAPDEADGDAADAPAPAGRIAPAAQPPRMSVLAIAASLVLIAGAVLFGIFGPQIGTIPGKSVVEQEVRAVAVFTSQEHGRCAGDDGARSEKAAWTDPLEAKRELERHLGAPVALPDLSDLGYAFVGAGRCMVPGSERSGHMIYARTSSEAGPAMASLFVVPNEGQFDTTPWREGSRWHVLDDRKACDHDVLCLMTEDLVWILVACDPDDLPPIAVRVALVVLGQR